MTVNIWKASVEGSETNISQIGSLWRNSSGQVVETMEVASYQLGSANPVLGIFYTNNGYAGSASDCKWNWVEDETPPPPCSPGGSCPNPAPVAWKQLSTTVTGGMTLSSSTAGGTQIEGRFVIEKVGVGPNRGDFRVWVGGVLVGRFLSECFPNLKSTNNMEQIWQGEVAITPGGAASATDMGSGVFPVSPGWGEANYRTVAYARNLGFLKKSSTGEYNVYQRYVLSNLTSKTTDSNCYKQFYWDCPNCSSGWRNYVFFGGPGRSTSAAPNCQ